MKEIEKKALWLSLIGFALGFAIGLLFYSLNGPESFLSQDGSRLALVLYLLWSGLFGAVNMGTSAVYGVEAWSILRCTFTHFCICVGSTAIFFGVMIAAGWMPMPPAGVCAVTAAAFLVVYVIIWLMQYLSYRRKVKNMNAKLREWKTRRK